ncbi:phosphorylase superfamily protein [Xylariales sp. PMI_506]|nr:phosphorylase superfamily protein [Xylariales sp. PMI_506]
MATDDESNSNLRRLRSRPVCIVCGRPSEAREIAKALGIEGKKHRLSGHDVSMVKDGHTFYLGEFQINPKETLKYYITSSLRQGIQSFTINAAILLNLLQPRFVLHAGVCAGYDSHHGIKLRDVVFGEAAINYEEGKFETVDNGDVLFRPDYNRVSVEAGDLQAFASAQGDLGYHYGEYISGSAVRSDAGAVFDKIRQQTSQVNRNAIALDMEASAFIQLCKHFEPHGPSCLGVVKGISDFGNSDKGKDETAYDDALKNTAAAIREWIIYRIPAISWEVDESGEPGAKIVPGYYENFVRRVVDNQLQGWPARYKDEPDVIIPNGEIQGFISVLPKARQPSFVKELGHVQNTMSKYGIREILIGGKTGERYLYYKAGYLIDWCRCVNSLEKYEDADYQVGVFERILTKQPYYKDKLDDGTTHARVMSWEEAMEWLEKTLKAEARVKTKAPTTTAPSVPAQTPRAFSEGQGLPAQRDDPERRRTDPLGEKRRGGALNHLLGPFRRRGGGVGTAKVLVRPVVTTAAGAAGG